VSKLPQPLQVFVNSVTNNGALTTPVTLNLSNAKEPSAANVFQVLDVDSGGTATVNLQGIRPVDSITTPTFSVVGADAVNCSVDAFGVVTITEVGSCRVRVTAPANDDYLASGQQTVADPVGVVTVWISTLAYDPDAGGPKPPVDTGSSTVDNSFKSPGDTAPALVVSVDPKVTSNLSFGSGVSMKLDPSGKITPKVVSRLVGSLTYVMSFSDKSNSFRVMGCPAKVYKDKAKKICKSPKLVDSATCTLTVVKKMTGKEFTKMQPFKFGSCQVTVKGLAKLKVANASSRPKLILKMDFKPLWPVNGKVKAISSRDGKFHTALRRKATFVMKFG
jgi:hypothetical protein